MRVMGIEPISHLFSINPYESLGFFTDGSQLFCCRIWKNIGIKLMIL